MSDERPWWLNWGLLGSDDIYGSLHSGWLVQEGMYQTLHTWMPSYINEFNRQVGGNALKQIKEYRFRPDYRTDARFGDEAAILVIVNGTQGEPEQQFGGSSGGGYRSCWDAEVMVWVYGSKDWQETQARTQAYAGCVLGSVVQHPGLGGISDGVLWRGSEYKEGEHTGLRTRGLATVKFEVSVPRTVVPFGGPPFWNPEPSLLPPEPLPDVVEVGITVEEDASL